MPTSFLFDLENPLFEKELKSFINYFLITKKLKEVD